MIHSLEIFIHVYSELTFSFEYGWYLSSKQMVIINTVQSFSLVRANIRG